jgi:hypothetical protein
MSLKAKALLYTFGVVCIYPILLFIGFPLVDIPFAYFFAVLYSTKAPLSYLYVLIGLVVFLVPLYLIIYFILKRKNKNQTSGIS